MKLWEVIKELTEDPKKKFELSDRGSRERIESDGNYLWYSRIDNGMVSDVPALEDNVDVNNNNWQLVRQPVTWQEAIQVWADGNRVTVEYEMFGGIVKHGKTPFGENISVNRNELIQGTWYVED